jgi:hypothetical protein
MVDPRLTFGCVPLCAGVALFWLGSHGASELLRSLGIMAFAFGILVLVLAAVGRS